MKRKWSCNECDHTCRQKNELDGCPECGGAGWFLYDSWWAGSYAWIPHLWRLSPSYIKNLLSPPADSFHRFYILDRWHSFKCRWKGHPCGSIYYNPGGYEPDIRCKNCYDELA